MVQFEEGITLVKEGALSSTCQKLMTVISDNKLLMVGDAMFICATLSLFPSPIFSHYQEKRATTRQ